MATQNGEKPSAFVGKAAPERARFPTLAHVVLRPMNAVPVKRLLTDLRGSQMNETASQPTAAAAAAAGRSTLEWFAHSVGVLLVTTGLAKAWSAIGPARALDVADPIIGIPFRHLLLAVGLLELFIAFFCLFTDKRQLSLLAVAWLSTNFVVYRLGLWWMGWHRPCGCMGNLTDLLHISPRAADNMMKVVLAYLLIGSYGLLLWQWRQRRQALSVVSEPVVGAGD